MRTLRQIEEDFRELDRKQGRCNPFYSKRKILAKSGKMAPTVPKTVSTGSNFWDVLAPEDHDDFGTASVFGDTTGRNSAIGNDRISTYGRRTSVGNGTLSQRSGTTRSQKNAIEASTLRLRPAAVQHRLTTMVQRTQATMSHELKMRRKSMKNAVKNASEEASSGEGVARHRQSVLGGDIKSGSSSPRTYTRTRSSSMFAGSPPPQISSTDLSSTGATDSVIAAPRIEAPKQAQTGNRARSQTLTQRTSNQSAWHQPAPQLQAAPTRIDKLQQNLTQTKKQIKATLHQIGYEDAEFFQFRIKVQNNSMLNIQDSSRIFMIITQDDNPALTAKVHDLQISDDMYVLFPTSQLTDITLFNPVDFLPWVKKPFDLFEHQLSVEIFVGLGVETSIIAKANVFYSPVDGIPRPQAKKSGLRDSLHNVDRIIDQKQYAPRVKKRSSEVGSHEDYVSASAQMEVDLPSHDVVRRHSTGENILRMPHMESDTAEEDIHDDSELHQTDPSKRIKVLKIEMKQRVALEPQQTSVGGQTASTSDYEHSNVPDSSKLGTPQGAPGEDASSDLSDSISGSPLKSSFLSSGHIPSDVEQDEESDEDDEDDLDEERMALMKSKQELKLLRERLKNRMEAGMV